MKGITKRYKFLLHIILFSIIFFSIIFLSTRIISPNSFTRINQSQVKRIINCIKNGGDYDEKNGKCNCQNNGYVGKTCEIPICKIKCENGGKCDVPNHCNCKNTGYRGRYCNIKIPSGKCKISPIQEIMKSGIYGEDGDVENPMDYFNMKYVQPVYSFTNILDEMIELIIDEINPCFWVEVGSWVGSSVIKTAKMFIKKSINAEIISIDTFLGSLNFFQFLMKPPINSTEIRKNSKHLPQDILDILNNFKKLDFVQFEKGYSTIFERFKANIAKEGLSDMVLPLTINSVVGLRLLRDMIKDGKLSKKVDAIYLDSAHEIDETYLELNLCWQILKPGGVIFGDDYDWNDVSTDVKKFANENEIDKQLTKNFQQKLSYSKIENDKILTIVSRGKDTFLKNNTQWLLIKKS